jgi:hypothetical protein
MVLTWHGDTLHFITGGESLVTVGVVRMETHEQSLILQLYGKVWWFVTTETRPPELWTQDPHLQPVIGAVTVNF